MNRRDFLSAGAISAASLPWLSLARAGEPLQGIVVVDNGVPESYDFAAAYAADRRLQCGLAQIPPALAVVQAAIARGAPVSGCTRESTAFVLEQLLRDARRRLQVLATHTYRRDGVLEHTFLRHHAGAASALAAYRSADWPRALAQALAATPVAGRSTPYTFAVPRQRPPASPGFLRTWCIS